MAYLLAGPLVAVIGIVAVFFVLRRTSIDKRSMYSARRSQIEHKVRAASHSPMARHGHAEKPVAPAASATSAGAWSVVSTSKDSAAAEPESKKKDRSAPASSWQLASGDSPVLDAEEPTAKRSSGTLMAVAQYAILVVGLVMVLIGVLVMVANSHVT